MLVNPKDTKLILTYRELTEKAGWAPLYVAPVMLFKDFYSRMFDIYKEEKGTVLKCSVITFPFSLSEGLGTTVPTDKLLLLERDKATDFKAWLTSYKLVQRENREYIALVPTHAPLADPVARAAGKNSFTAIGDLCDVEIITYASNKGVVDVQQPLVLLPPPPFIKFISQQPTLSMKQEAEAYFNPKGK